MPSALSADLRERVATAIEAGASRREAARRFEVSPAIVVRWHETFVRGADTAKPMGGDQRSHAVETQARPDPADLRGAARTVPARTGRPSGRAWPAGRGEQPVTLGQAPRHHA